MSIVNHHRIHARPEVLRELGGNWWGWSRWGMGINGRVSTLNDSNLPIVKHRETKRSFLWQMPIKLRCWDPQTWDRYLQHTFTKISAHRLIPTKTLVKLVKGTGSVDFGVERSGNWLRFLGEGNWLRIGGKEWGWYGRPANQVVLNQWADSKWLFPRIYLTVYPLVMTNIAMEAMTHVMMIFPAN